MKRCFWWHKRRLKQFKGSLSVWRKLSGAFLACPPTVGVGSERPEALDGMLCLCCKLHTWRYAVCWHPIGRGCKTHCKILWFYPRGHRSQENAMPQWLSLTYFLLVLSLKQIKGRRYKAFHLAGAPQSWPMVSGFPPPPSFPSCLSGSVTAPWMAASGCRGTTLRKSYAGTIKVSHSKGADF